MRGKRLEQGRKIAERHLRHLARDGYFWTDQLFPLIHYQVGDREVTREEWMTHQMGLWRKTRCFCSTCCGNPRRFYGHGWLGETMQERKLKQRGREEQES